MTRLYSFVFGFVIPWTEILEKDFLRWFKHAACNARCRTVTAVCTVRKRRAKYINLLY